MASLFGDLRLLLAFSLLSVAVRAEIKHHVGIPYIAPTALINETCAGVTYHDICTFVLTGNPYAIKFDLAGVAGVGIEGTVKKGNMIMIRIDGLLNRFHPASLQDRIRDCKTYYEGAISGLQKVHEGLPSPGGIAAALQELAAAMAAADKCEAGCQSQEFEKWVLTTRNEDFKKYCTNAVEIIKKLPAH